MFLFFFLIKFWSCWKGIEEGGGGGGVSLNWSLKKFRHLKTYLKTVLCAKIQILESVILMHGGGILQKDVLISAEPGHTLDLVEQDLVPDPWYDVPGDGHLGLVAAAYLKVLDGLGAGLGHILTVVKLDWDVALVADAIDGIHSHFVSGA